MTSSACVATFMLAAACEAADLAFTAFSAETNGVSFTLEWRAGVALSGQALDVFHAHRLSPPCWSNCARYAGISAGTNAHSGFIPFVGAPHSGFFRAADIADSDGDGLTDAEEEWVWHTDSHNRDSDGDGIPDGWEIANGLSPLVPWDMSALVNASFAIDSRIAGKNPSNAVCVFSVQEHANTNYVRNPDCWAADIDLTCCSPWNGTLGTRMAGTLISPRHVLFAAHYDGLAVGTAMRFVDMQNQVVERTLVDKIRHPNYVDWYPDFTVGLLDADVPTNRISFAKVLPDNYRDWLGDGTRLPVLGLDQEEKALICDLRQMSAVQTINSVRGNYIFFDTPVDAVRRDYYKDLIVGDSGNPAFLIIGGKPVLLTVWTFTGPNAGTSLVDLKQDINAIMQQLEMGQGSTDGYQLEAVALSGFVPR